MAYIGRSVNYGNAVTEQFVGDGTDDYTLAYETTTDGVVVSLDGVVQVNGTDFNILGNVITFTSVVAAPIAINLVYLGLTLSIGTPGNGTVGISQLSATGTADATKFLRGDGSWQVVAVPLLDSPVISGTLAVLDGGTVTHTITNWSDDVSYTITPTNCSAGAVNGSGEFVITHTSGDPSYTIRATTASLGLDDSALVSKDITMQLTAPTLSSPADSPTLTNVIYTITSTTTNDDKLILDIGSSNFNFGSVSVGSASKVGNTVECTGFTTNNPAVTIQYTAEATYSVTAKSVHIAGTYTTSANSSADSITIINYQGMVATGGVTPHPVVDTNYKIAVFNSSAQSPFTITTLGELDEIEYLIVAGGGGGGGASGAGAGGGGAGGMLTASGVTVTQSAYNITVGGGGPGAVDDDTYTNGTVGDDSVISGSGVSVTADGGGFGAGGYGGATTPGDGGSGGGAGHSTTAGGSATSGQGSAGGSCDGATSPYGGAGGGGKGGAALNNNDGNPSAGGAGLNSSITDSAVGYAGGGGGGASTYGGTAGTATHGGGAGGAASTIGNNGTANTGGGGGGSGNLHGGGNGGSGVVIIKYKFQDA